MLDNSETNTLCSRDSKENMKSTHVTQEQWPVRRQLAADSLTTRLAEASLLQLKTLSFVWKTTNLPQRNPKVEMLLEGQKCPCFI